MEHVRNTAKLDRVTTKESTRLTECEHLTYPDEKDALADMSANDGRVGCSASRYRVGTFRSHIITHADSLRMWLRSSGVGWTFAN